MKFIITGPIGVGKTTVLNHIKNCYKNISIIEEFNSDDFITKEIIKDTYREKKILNPEIKQMSIFCNRHLTFEVANNIESKNEYCLIDRAFLDPIVFAQIFNDSKKALRFYQKILKKEKIKNVYHIILDLDFEENKKRVMNREREGEDGFIVEKVIRDFNKTMVKLLKKYNYRYVVLDVNNMPVEQVAKAIVNEMEKVICVSRYWSDF